jgi:mannose-6-phosphate isomerase-like protein (cupin superfamily)/ketosteroid isomerase-like protein
MRDLILGPGEGLSVENPMGGLFTFKITSDETDGALTAIETFIVQQEGPPLHVHEQDEVIYILEGSMRVKLGDTLRPAPAGTFVFIPRGTPHTWQNVVAEPLRFFATIMPATAAFEEFFKRYAQLPSGKRGVEAFGQIAAETNAFQVVGPPLAESDPHEGTEPRALAPMSFDDRLDRYHRAVDAFSRGDPEPVKELYSETDDVTLANPFGPARRGRAAVNGALDYASGRMSDGQVVGFDELARYASNDLATILEVEHWRARIGDRDSVEPFDLRVTTTFRRERGEWRIVHRHADPFSTEDESGPLRTS